MKNRIDETFPGAASASIDGGLGPAAAGAGIFQRLRSDRLAAASALLAMLLVAIALLVPLLPLADPIMPDYDKMLAGPSTENFLGTDLQGRDQLSRLLWASRASLFVGIAATAGALAIGMTIGGLAGFFGGLIDGMLMRTADAFFSFPVILGAIAFVAALGPGLRNVFLAIVFFGWPIFARLFRASVISVRRKDFINAARTLGASNSRIFLRHVLPDSVTAIVSYTALSVAGAVMIESGLSFINLGIQRPYASWGLMLAESMGHFEQAPWLVLAPGAAVTFTAFVFMLMGTALSRLTHVGT